MKMESKKQKDIILTEEEENLFTKYLEEYNDTYPKILLLNPLEFFQNITKGLEFSLKEKINGFSQESKTKTGKKMYVMKNVIDPKYEMALKQQKAQLSNQNHNKAPIDNNKNQHIIQQKVLVTDPKTGKQMYVMKNVVDPKYAQQKQLNDKTQNNQKMPLNNQNNPKNDLKLQEQKEAQNKIKEEIKKYQLYINTLIKEYTEAKEYFKK